MDFHGKYLTKKEMNELLRSKLRGIKIKAYHHNLSCC